MDTQQCESSYGTVNTVYENHTAHGRAGENDVKTLRITMESTMEIIIRWVLPTDHTQVDEITDASLEVMSTDPVVTSSETSDEQTDE